MFRRPRIVRHTEAARMTTTMLWLEIEQVISAFVLQGSLPGVEDAPEEAVGLGRQTDDVVYNAGVDGGLQQRVRHAQDGGGQAEHPGRVEQVVPLLEEHRQAVHRDGYLAERREPALITNYKYKDLSATATTMLQIRSPANPCLLRHGLTNWNIVGLTCKLHELHACNTARNSWTPGGKRT